MASSSDSEQQRDSYRQHLFDNIIVKRTRLRTRNGETREWSLVAKRNIPSGMFIGFYTGQFMGGLPNDKPSLYALDLGRGQPAILPFPDEDHVSALERDRHPLACANEPAEGLHANAHMEPVDFAAREVEGVGTIYNHEIAHFFRGLACFACADIQPGEQITWHYGAAYESNRQLMDYVAGFPCKKVIDGVPYVDTEPAVLGAVSYTHLTLPTICSV